MSSPRAPRCFCGVASRLDGQQFICGSSRCPFRLRAASDGTPLKGRPPSNSSVERCPCGEAATSVTISPSGDLPGRLYMRCARPMPNRCNYLRIIKKITSGDSRHDVGRSDANMHISTGASSSFFGNRPRSGSSGPSRPSTAGSGGTTAADSDEDAPPCKCGKEAVKRTVKKEGANKGKQFFVCQKGMGNQCGFFEWADQKAVKNKRQENPQQGVESVAKRARNWRFSISLDLEEIDKLSFRIRQNSPEELRKAVQEFEDAKVEKTEFIGVEKVVVPMESLLSFESHLLAKAETKLEYNIPRATIDRILMYRDTEKQREDNGDVVTRSLDEILPMAICEKLMQFQWHGVHFALKRGGRCLIGDDMGLGKTLQAIAVARVYIADWPLLIVCPSSLRLNWKEELLRWLEDDLDDADILVMMTGKDIDKPLRRVNVVSYDLMRKIPPEFVRRCKFIIADESHYLKSMTAQRSKALTPLLRKAKRALLLSGTPALSRPVELFPQINAISPILFPNYQEFVERYCSAHIGRFGYDVSGASNLDELHTLLRGSLLIRRKKEEVLTQLPEKQRQVLWVQTKPKIMKEVAKAFAELESAKERSNAAANDANALALQNDVKAAQNLLYTLSGDAKVDAVLEYCKDTAETGCKFIVFAHHASVIGALDKYISGKLKLGTIRIDGGTAQGVRQQLCRKFQEDKNCRVAILSITAAGVGLTLTKATVVIFAELYWNPGSLLQAEDRAHRIGQRDCVLVKYLLARRTMDESMWGTVRRKLTVVGHSLTGTAGRMEVIENQNPKLPPGPSSIASFFKPKNKSNATQGSVADSQLDEEVIEIVNGVSQTQPSQGQNEVAKPGDPSSSGDPSILEVFPTSLREIEGANPPHGVNGSHLPSDLVVDLTASRDADGQVLADTQRAQRLHEQMDADVALARKLQAQFDAEGVS